MDARGVRVQVAPVYVRGRGVVLFTWWRNPAHYAGQGEIPLGAWVLLLWGIRGMGPPIPEGMAR